jgi:hypothetical protein
MTKSCNISLNLCCFDSGKSKQMHRRTVFFKVKKVGHLVNDLKTPCLTAFCMGSMTDPEPKTCHNTLNICAILQHGVSLADSQHAIPLAIPAKIWSIIGCFRKYTYAGYIYLFKKTVEILTILRYE